MIDAVNTPHEVSTPKNELKKTLAREKIMFHVEHSRFRHYLCST